MHCFVSQHHQGNFAVLVRYYYVKRIQRDLCNAEKERSVKILATILPFNKKVSTFGNCSLDEMYALSMFHWINSILQQQYIVTRN